MKWASYIILATSMTFSIQAEVKSYGVSIFKKSGKIAQKSIYEGKKSLKQSYDTNGKLFLESYTLSNEAESVCYLPNRKKLISNDLKSAEEFFVCLQLYQEMLDKEGGMIKGNHKAIINFKFEDRGKDLREAGK